MQKGGSLLIFPRPSESCQYCNVENPCPCECHEKDLINGHHYHVHIEEFDMKVKSVRDLDHFRKTGLKLWLSDKIYWFRVKYFNYDSD